MPNHFKCDSYEEKTINGQECFRCAHVTAAGICPCLVKWMSCYRVNDCEYCKNKRSELCDECVYKITEDDRKEEVE